MDEKKSTIIESCDRCNKKLVIERKRHDNVLPHAYKYQKCEGEHIFKLYLKTLGVTENRNSMSEKFTDTKLFCAACDEAFNENLYAAVAKIESFWNEADE